MCSPARSGGLGYRLTLHTTVTALACILESIVGDPVYAAWQSNEVYDATTTSSCPPGHWHARAPSHGANASTGHQTITNWCICESDEPRRLKVLDLGGSDFDLRNLPSEAPPRDRLASESGGIHSGQSGLQYLSALYIFRPPPA